MSHKIDCLECFIEGERQGEKTGSLVELERALNLLEDEMNRLEGWTGYPAINALMSIRAALIKGEK